MEKELNNKLMGGGGSTFISFFVEFLSVKTLSFSIKSNGEKKTNEQMVMMMINWFTLKKTIDNGKLIEWSLVAHYQ